VPVTRYEFDWDSSKAEANIAKHGVAFELAMTVFHDPLAMSRFDDDNSDYEPRWVTLGETRDAQLLVVVHTYVEITPEQVAIRIISARRPTGREMRQYREGNEP
jgi:uncharacterized DUF497 family protein